MVVSIPNETNHAEPGPISPTPNAVGRCEAAGSEETRGELEAPRLDGTLRGSQEPDGAELGLLENSAGRRWEASVGRFRRGGRRAFVPQVPLHSPQDLDLFTYKSGEGPGAAKPPYAF